MKIIIAGLILVLQVLSLQAKNSPHGKDFKLDCTICHTTEDWLKIKNKGFDHNSTRFPLKGQHKEVGCRQCHQELEFSKASTDCASCHKDVHENTLGSDCARCHNEESWIVSDVRKLHREQGFTMSGVHATLDCRMCHAESNELRFNNMGKDCYSCHQGDYLATTDPNHVQEGYSKNCEECHSVSSIGWTGANGINHDFFPLKGGHDTHCFLCHLDGYQVKPPTDCYSCHQSKYEETTNPPHELSGFSKDCSQCHGIETWNEAKFDHDNLYFPIYSGKHRGQWDACTDCHENTENYAEFTCISCHEHNKSSMDKKHDDEKDYVYNSINCLSCHPRGRSEDD